MQPAEDDRDGGDASCTNSTSASKAAGCRQRQRRVRAPVAGSGLVGSLAEAAASSTGRSVDMGMDEHQHDGSMMP